MRRGKGAPQKRPANADPVNGEIMAHSVLAIGGNGDNLGVIALRDAIAIAKRDGLDLVQVAPGKNGVPVCKMVDYGKWKFDKSKKDRKVRQQSKKTQTKEIKLRPNTSDHDMGYRVKRAIGFLESGNRVKVVVRFRGREHQHMIDTGRNTMERFMDMMDDENLQAEGPAEIEAHAISVVFVPSGGGGK